MHSAVTPIALVLERHLPSTGERGQRREDVRELRLDVVVEHCEPSPLEALEILVQRIHDHREGKVSLKLGCGSPQDEVPAPLSASGQLPEQPRLADPGFAHQLDRARAASIELVEYLLERTELAGAPDDGLGR